MEIFESKDCPRCVRSHPKLEAMLAKLGNKVSAKFIEVTDPANWARVEELHIERIPSIYMMGTTFWNAPPEEEDFIKMCNYQWTFLNSYRVIITTPHASCPANNTHHLCDTIVKELSRLIEQKLKEAKRAVKRLVGDIPRNECDLNRWDCRETTFRKELKRVIAIPGNAMLIDLHSYPPEEPGWGDFDTILLRVENADRELMEIVKSSLMGKGYKVNMADGSSANDLVPSHGKETRAFLIEINERLSNDLEDVASAIVQTVCQVVPESPSV